MRETITLKDMFPYESISLDRLSVFNWGSFDGLHTADFNPQGNIISGTNGSGKSTLIDALMTLFVSPHRSRYNLAASQESSARERSLLTYMRGSYANEHDGTETRAKNLRPHGVTTAVCARYITNTGNHMTMLGIFWLPNGKNKLSDVSKLYATINGEIELKDVLSRFSDGNVRNLKQYIESFRGAKTFLNSFEEYSQTYQQMLYIENSKAPALIQRAMGLKNIDSMTGMIRNLVLEPSKVRDIAKEAVEGFETLSTTHRNLLDARAQAERLEPMAQAYPSLEKNQHTLNELEENLNGLQTFVYQQQLTHLETQQREHEETRAGLSESAEAIKLERSSLEERVESCHAAYLDIGGDRIEQVKRNISLQNRALEQASRHARVYQMSAQAVGLPDELKSSVVKTNQKSANNWLQNDEINQEAAYTSLGEKNSALNDTKKELESVLSEWQVAKSQPESNIPAQYQQLRTLISEHCGVPAERLCFLGELIDVKEQEIEWRGAIERALGHRRLTLLVDEDDYPSVTQLLNDTHTQLHVRVEVVRQHTLPDSPAAFFDDGFLRKLNWKPHAWREWLKHHLVRADRHCKDSVDLLRTTEFSMTRAGLMQNRFGAFEKNDRHGIADASHWHLGFNNEQRLAQLTKTITNLEAVVKTRTLAYNEAKQAVAEQAELKRHYQLIANANFQDMDVTRVMSNIDRLKAELHTLTEVSLDVKDAKKAYEQAKEELADVQSRQNTISNEMAILDSTLNGIKTKANNALRHINSEVGIDVLERLAKQCGEASPYQLENDIGGFLSSQHNTISRERERAMRRRSDALKIVTSAIDVFRDRWPELTTEWQEGLDGVREYIAYYDELVKDGLPSLVERFRNRLNESTTESLAQIRRTIDNEKEDIQERIDTINEVLARTDFKANSYLRIKCRNEKFAHVREFEKDLTQALQMMNSENDEQRYELLARVMGVLERASGTAFSNKENLRLLDPRHQMIFLAEEVEKETGDILDVLISSQSKSGGEKESFAGTILAATLSYVLTPEGAPSPIWRTVFLDEAFSNTAEAVGRRVLKVFEALNLNVNLITPNKNIELARDHVHSLILAEKEPGGHKSRVRSGITWEQVDALSQERGNAA